MGAEDDGTYATAVCDEQPHDVMISEDQQDLKELLDARAGAQHQLDVLVTGLIRGGWPSGRPAQVDPIRD
jgi:hypothetical protein